MRWLTLAVALSTLWVAVWVVLPPSNYFLLRFAVGAPEVSAWLIIASLVGLALAVPRATTSTSARLAIAACIVSIVLAACGTWRALQYFHGRTLVVSILACWLLPIVGALIVLAACRRWGKKNEHKKA